METAQKIVEQAFMVVVGMHTHPVGISTELKDAQVKLQYKETKNYGETLQWKQQIKVWIKNDHGPNEFMGSKFISLPVKRKLLQALHAAGRPAREWLQVFLATTSNLGRDLQKSLYRA